MLRYRSWLTQAPYNPGCIPLFLDYLGSPEFTIREVTRMSEDGVDLAKVDFAYRPKDSKKPTLEGWLRLETARTWVIHDYDFDMRIASVREGARAEAVVRNKGFVKYREEDGKPVPAEIEVSKTARNGNTLTDHTSVSEFLFKPSPPEDFTLAAFGLGDYELTLSEAQTRSTYRNLAIAVGAFLAAFVLFRLGRSIHKNARGSRVETVLEE